MSLAFSSLDDAFTSLTGNDHVNTGRASRHKHSAANKTTSPAVAAEVERMASPDPHTSTMLPYATNAMMMQPPSWRAGAPQRAIAPVSSVADDLIRMLPFAAMVFMILVLWLVYDIRQRIVDMQRLYMHSAQRVLTAPAFIR